MKTKNSKTEKRLRRRKRIRARVFGTVLRPRLSVFRSNRCIYAALIDDESRKTLTSASSLGLAAGKDRKSKTIAATEVGVALAKRAIERNLRKAVFDRGGYVYAGRVKALAEAARKGGLEF